MMRKIMLLPLLLFFTMVAFAQTHVITGKVTDESGLPIQFATIKVKGAKNGTSADESGKFTIAAPANATLIISAQSMEQAQVNVGNQNDVTVKLKPAGALSELVFTGVGVGTNKKKLGISVESITADKLPPTPTASIDQALVGKIPGAMFQSVGGTPGAATAITLRGINTIQGGTKPLILLDGVEVKSDINSLDLNNIERVEVVQGSASATIYGAQGANGVIQLFSKKGKKGQLNINLSSSKSSDTYINQGNVHQSRMHSYKTDASGNVVDINGNVIQLDPYGIYQGVTFAFPANTTTTPGATYVGAYATAQYNPNNIYNKAYDHNLKYYDHLAQIFTTASTLNNTLNLSGGSDKVDYNFGISNNHQTSTIRNNGYVDRSNFSMNVGVEVFKNFKIRSITELVNSKSTLNPYYSTGRGNIFNLLNLAPFYDLNQRLPDGTFPYNLAPDNGVHSANGFNPNFDFEYVSQKENRVEVFQNFDINYNLNKFLEFDAKYAVNYRRDDVNRLYKDMSQNTNVIYESSWESTYNSTDPNGEIVMTNNSEIFQNFLGSVYFRTDFKRDFNSKIPLTTSTQLSYDYRNDRFNAATFYGKHLQFFPVYNLGQTNSQNIAVDATTPFITFGYLVNQRFDLGDYGGISGGFRSDYSSAFGSGSKPFTFPRADGYLRLSSFNFWKNSGVSKMVNEFKIRAAYGEAGIQPLPFDRYPTLSSSNIGSSIGLNLKKSLNDANINVENSKETEYGFDLALKPLNGKWLSRINLNTTYWTRVGSDVIFTVSAPPSEGVNTLKTNAIGLASHGLQASINLGVYKSHNLSWDFTANYGQQTSIINHIAGHSDIILTASAGASSLVLREGQPIGQIYGYKAFTSLDQTRLDGTPYIQKSDYGKYQIVNGRVVDTATKAIMFTNEKYALGTGNPKFNMSFINSITYKDFLTLGFQFDWVYKNYLYNQTNEWMYRDGFSRDYDKPVTINGTTAAFSPYYRSAYAAIFGDLNGAGRNGTKDYFLEDASFVRLRNVSLGVDISKLANIKTFKRLQFVLSGRNLITWTKYSGFDPEINSSSTVNSAFDRGIDHNSTPNTRSYQIGINVGF